MANLLDRFNKEVIGSDGRVYDYLTKITASGSFKRIRDIDVIINSWNNILLTPRRTYIHDPEYGSDLHKLVFEPADENTVDRIKTEVEQRLTIYDDRAIIEDVEIILKPNGKGFTVNILADYQGEQGTLSVKFDDSTSLGARSQEI